MTSPFPMLVISLAALILLLMIVIILIRQNGKQQLSYQREQLMRIRAQADEFIPPRIRALDEWKAEVHTAIRIAQSNRPKRRGEERDQYDRHLFEDLLHYKREEQFFRIADKHLDGFILHMREYYQLSDREMMFICLSLLALSDEQIALIMNYSEASLPTTRSRIGKKLGITNSSDWNSSLVEFIQQI